MSIPPNWTTQETFPKFATNFNTKKITKPLILGFAVIKSIFT